MKINLNSRRVADTLAKAAFIEFYYNNPDRDDPILAYNKPDATIDFYFERPGHPHLVTLWEPSDEDVADRDVLRESGKHAPVDRIGWISDAIGERIDDLRAYFENETGQYYADLDEESIAVSDTFRRRFEEGCVVDVLHDAVDRYLNAVYDALANDARCPDWIGLDQDGELGAYFAAKPRYIISAIDPDDFRLDDERETVQPRAEFFEANRDLVQEWLKDDVEKAVAEWIEDVELEENYGEND